MTIRESEYFIFAGEQSDTIYGIRNVNISSGMQEEPFVAPRQLRETKIRDRDKPYFNGIDYEPLQFQLSFAFDDYFDDDKVRAVARWLTDHNYYKPLKFSSNPTRTFYCMVVDSPQLIHNTLKQGYITLAVRCNSPYSVTDYREKIYNLSSNIVDGTDITFENLGDLPIKPKLTILKYGTGDDIVIRNDTDGGNEFILSNLADQETVVVNGETEDIISDLPGIYHYDDHIGGYFLKLLYGKNYLNVSGNCELKFTYQFKNLF
jgi:phage-related protein